jgi:predicted porin
MKKTLLVAAIATLAAGTAAAQSNVTIYGRVNLTAERQDRDGDKTSVLQNNASRIGFRGTEDLGGGLKAGFVLEHGFNADTGTQTQGAFWARQSELNLGGTWGLLRLGNFTSEAYYATADYISMHNHDTGTSSDALYAYLGRNVNKIGYRLPELMKGLQAEVGYQIKETAASNIIDLAVNYDAGPLHLGFGYEKDGRGSAPNANQWAVRGLYELGAITVGAYYQRDKNGYAAGNRNNFRLSGMYTMGASEFHANIGRANSYSDVDDSSATQWTLGYNYNLSKRTKVYGFYTKLNDGAAGVYGGDFNSFAVGMRHNF